MASDFKMTAKFNDFKKALNSAVASRADRICQDLSKKICDVFVDKAKENLNRATPKDGISNALVEQVKNNIYASRSASKESKWIISVDRDPEDLCMFLEYGTGLNGGFEPHPEASKIGWDYMVNVDNPKIYKWYKNDLGWFFSANKSTYIDEHDEYPVVEYKTMGIAEDDVKPYFRKGKLVNLKGYHRVRPYYLNGKIKETVFSHGLYPVRYFYDAKIFVKDLLSKVGKYTRSDPYAIKQKDIIAFIDRELQGGAN